jgi:hypothetical protein
LKKTLIGRMHPAKKAPPAWRKQYQRLLGRKAGKGPRGEGGPPK